ncbi:MAG TPA: intradiol ring-cleavage dioxygenase [Casimicrobiaceae bacterium]|nr:intradiol ring-cleavage dioxygenase [Casimicrobiaceae bacterium]
MTSDPLRGRRHTMRVLAASGVALVARTASAQRETALPACVLTPAQTEGPFFVDERLERADIRSDPTDGSIRQGVPLLLALRIVAVTGRDCQPARDAIVDVWHCDAAGIYSDADGMGLRTRGSKFLRGYQVSDASGEVRFTTIYPGAYRGRAVHVHFKVRTNTGARRDEFTSQLYFDDALTDRVHAAAPYAASIRQRTRNVQDGLFRMNGRALILDARPAAEGYASAFDVGLRAA